MSHSAHCQPSEQQHALLLNPETPAVAGLATQEKAFALTPAVSSIM